MIFTACPDAKAANRIATTLVDERLAACVNIVSGVRSVYRWKGKPASSRETLLIIKARRANYRRIERRIVELHPYELPEVVSVRLADGYARYLAWIDNPEEVT